MAQTGYTPIQLYYSTTAAAVPTNTNLANGELAINITDGKLYYKDNTGTVKLLTSTGSEISPITNNGVVYINGSGQATSGSALTFDGTNLGVGANITASAASAPSFTVGTGSGSPAITLYSATTGSSQISFADATSGGGAYDGYVLYNQNSQYMAFGIASSEQMRLTSTGLGIGTSTPGFALDIAKAKAVLRVQSTTATNASYMLTSNNGGDFYMGRENSAGTEFGTTAYSSVLWSAGAYPMSFFTNGIERMRIDSSGNVGIGSSTVYNGGGFGTVLSIYNSTAAALSYASASRQYQVGINSANQFGIYDATASAYRFVVATDGSVGIGTTNPAFQLDVQGPSQSNGDAVRNMVVLSTTSAGSGYGGGIGFGGYYNGTSSSINDFASIQGFKENSTAGDYAGALRFTTRANGGSPTERLRIASNGAWGLAGANYGSAGQVLTSNGSGAAPSWQAGGGGASAATPTALGTVYGKTDASTLAFLGYQAGNANTSGVQSVAIGTGALQSNVTNNYNTAVGYYALQTATADQNVAVGWYALQKSTTGGGNTAVGAYVMNSNLGGAQNTALGFAALNSNTTGSANVAIGYQALYSNTTGGTNIGIGYNAGYGLRTNTLTPGQNIAIGNEALYSSSHAAYNIAIGYQALRGAGDNGGSSIAIGQQAGRICATPGSSIFIGYAAAYSNTYWIGGICIGQAAGYSYNDPGTPYPGNFFVGDGAGRSVTTGTGNVMLGAGESGYSGGPGRNTTSGSQNTVLGTAAFTTNTTSSNSTAIGYATISNSTGANNTALGSYAGTYNGGSGGATTSGAGNTFLGCQTIAANATDSYNVIIGYAIVGKGNATGYISANGGSIYQGNNSSSWATTSDRRLKKNIVDNTVGLEKLTQIQVRNFEYRLPEEVDAELKPHDAINKSGVQIGVIAQELQAVLPDCVKQESTGVLSVDPDNLTWYMVNAIKELNAKIEAQAAEIAILKGQA